jgi:hypothetical protein
MTITGRKDWYEKRMTDLGPWHRRLHQVTGSMALRWVKATPAELTQWARELRAVADEMQTTASAPVAPADRTTPPDTDARYAEHERP